MKIRSGALVLAFAGAVSLGACSDVFVPDFDNPAQQDYAVIKTRAQLQSRAIGLLDNDRQTHDFQILLDETIGRDVYRLDGAESRYITTPLGPTPMNNVNFVGTSIYTGPYRTIRDANLLIGAVEASEAASPTPLTAEEKSGTAGYAQTIAALQYMRVMEQRDTVGAPIVGPVDADGLYAFHCKKDVLMEASRLLSAGRDSLAAAGTSAFPFELPSGFTGFDTPATFIQFNWALAARNYVYLAFQANTGTPIAAYLDSAQLALDNSFYAPSGSLDLGVYHNYSSASGDYANPNFDQSVYRINPRVVYESEGVTVTVDGNGDTIAVNAPDLRVQQKVELDPTNNCKAVRDASSCFLDKGINTSSSTPIPLIRNDELHLLQAEVYWGRNTAGTDAQALAIVNDVRQRGGGFGTPLAIADHGTLLREILRQKRYQLLFQSPSRWVDYRMFGILNELGQERELDPVPNFRTPVAEVFARKVSQPEDIPRVCNP